MSDIFTPITETESIRRDIIAMSRDSRGIEISTIHDLQRIERVAKHLGIDLNGLDAWIAND